jgi:hypothetical protein
MTPQDNTWPLLSAETPDETEAYDRVTAATPMVSDIMEIMSRAEAAGQEASDLEGRSRKALLRSLSAAYEIYLRIRRDPVALEAFMRRAKRGGNT